MHREKDYMVTVIGVAGSVKTNDLAERDPIGQIYYNYQQYPRGFMFLVVNRGGNDVGVASAIRREFAKADPELPLFDVKTMDERMTISVRERRAAMAICASFCRLGAGALGNRDLRRAGVYGDTANARVRYSDCAGGGLRFGSWHGDGAGNAVGRSRVGNRSGGRDSADAIDGQNAL